MSAPERISNREAERRLITNLREQHDLQQRMLGDLQAKRDALRAADMSRVFAISEREQRTAERMMLLEQQRQWLIGLLMPISSDTGGTPPTIQDLLPHLTEATRRDVDALHVSLRDRVHRVLELSAIVRSASETLHQHINGVVQSMQRVLSEAGVYERRGVIAGGQRLASTIDVRS